MIAHPAEIAADSISTGVAGLDEVLCGGLLKERLFLVEGSPGSGKTTLALQFLREGVARGERVLFVALSESIDELKASAASHGWTLDGIELYGLPDATDGGDGQSRYTMFHPSEVELSETVKAVLAVADRLEPSRLVFDSLSELRLLAENPLRYRRQILALKQHFAHRPCTVLLIDDGSDPRVGDLHSIAHGVIAFDRRESDYGTLRRRISVLKMRGRAFREGFHDLVIKKGGLVVFPRLVAAEHHEPYQRSTVASGLPQVDALLGGGLARGTSTLVQGPSGTGKSSLCAQFASAVASRGQRVSFFLFEEGMATFLERTRGLGMDLESLMDKGLLQLRQIDPGEMAPGEFTAIVRAEAEAHDTALVVIDSLNGYLNAMPNERFLILHLHELLTFLAQHGVTTLMTLTQHGVITGTEQSPVDASYLADTVILLRYFEALGEVRQALSVIKKRTGVHERTIRELRFDQGIHVGEPVRDFQGVLTGVPQPLQAEGPEVRPT